MDIIDRAALDEQKLMIKPILKAWENEFREKNGRKAGREDIKANPEIALKYKEYNHIQDMLSGKLPAPKQSSPSTQKRERSESHLSDSPSKRRRSLHDTPQRQSKTFLAPPMPRKHDAEYEDENLQQTPALKRTLFLGPTPQKNGTVLGIFDSPPVAARTPSRKDTRAALAELDGNTATTPSSQRVDKIDQSPEAQYEERARGSRTPASTGKRFMLDAFLTPSHNRTRVNNESEELPATPSSTIRTPAFLRRDNFSMQMSAITEDVEQPTSPQMVRAQPWKRRSFGRSLSQVIKDMRGEEKAREAEQEAREDEELDLLNELEDEANGIERPKPAPKIIVQDSQAGFEGTGLDRDGFVPSDVEVEVEVVQPVRIGKDGKPMKPWKKKGLKRQHRRVNMRPVAKKAGAHPDTVEEAGSGDEEDAVQETQHVADEHSDHEDGSEDECSDAPAKSKSKAKTKSKATTKNAKDKAETTEKKAPAKRKVKAEAHANYRALKIKNKGSKGGGGGRFGGRGRR